MLRFILRRLAIIPPVLLLINFGGFAYAHIAQQAQRAHNPFGVPMTDSPPVSVLYAEYLRGVLRLDWGTMPAGVSQTIVEGVAQATGASLGLLGIAFAISLLAGLVLGLMTVRTEPVGVSPWLTPLSTVGLALPSFYVGTLFIVASVYYILQTGPEAKPPLPLSGFGWDIHILLPTLALIVRPAVQIA